MAAIIPLVECPSPVDCGAVRFGAYFRFLDSIVEELALHVTPAATTALESIRLHPLQLWAFHKHCSWNFICHMRAYGGETLKSFDADWILDSVVVSLSACPSIPCFHNHDTIRIEPHRSTVVVQG